MRLSRLLRAAGRAAALLALLPCLAAAQAPAGPAPAVAERPACDPAEVVLLAPGGPARFAVELALTPEEQARGLMFRPHLAEDAGMLFLYEPVRPAAFWMKNTMIPLDIVFLDEAGKVLNIAARAVPYSLEPRRSDGPVRAVLEINGGLAEALGIGPGTQAIHPLFEAAPAPHRCPAP